jgi:radical SAM superfamily enzyme YgiQ (UPF0313 family)
MKVTFISPSYHNFWEPIGIGYIISYCDIRYNGKLDIDFYHENFDSIIDIVDNASKSDIVGITCTTPTYKRATQIAEYIKRKNKSVKIVLGGWHPTVIGKNESEFVDQIVVGEGETAFLEILNGNTDSVIIGERLPFSELHWPNRTTINEKRHLDYCFKEFGERIASFQSIRGCKMKCAMCAEKYMSGGKLRLRDPVDTLDEIEYVDEIYHIDKLKFLDATWAVSEEYVKSFCEEKIRRKNKLPWDAMVHAAFATEESLRLMKLANCDIIMVGVESGSQMLLVEVGKGVTIEKIRKVFEWGKKYGLQRRAFFILGMPNETPETIFQTLQLAEDLDPDVFGMTILCPYPGTKYYDPVKHKDVDWSKADEYSNDFWYTKNFSNDDLKRIQKSFVERFKDKIPWHQKYFLGGHSEI